MLQKYRQVIKKWEKWHQDPHDEHGQIAANPLDEYRSGLADAEERRLAKEIKKHDRWKVRDLQRMTALQLTRLARRAQRFDSPNLAAAAIVELASRNKIEKQARAEKARTEADRVALPAKAAKEVPAEYRKP